MERASFWRVSKVAFGNLKSITTTARLVKKAVRLVPSPSMSIQTSALAFHCFAPERRMDLDIAFNLVIPASTFVRDSELGVASRSSRFDRESNDGTVRVELSELESTSSASSSLGLAKVAG